ncbi:fumarylacetoacetate hydrolase family protein [Acrocarpospora sp. B8E8]|uniref:fumarylacetoacetate hydrolase family protein n=1 Tax=Acrocarpospora sp. B8E8 TaxID=3153572 RepID=UPI00325F8639
MRIISYTENGRTQGGVALGEHVVELGSAVAYAGFAIPDGGPLSVRVFLGLDYDRDAVLAAAVQLVKQGRVRPLSELRLAPPVPDPDKILCIGLNYRDHAEEAGLALPSEPMVFAKFRNCLIGAEDEVVLPDESERVDYEAELAVVIGRRGRAITEERALDHIAGVTVFNDVTARNLQLATSQWTLGKSVDTFGPCGPYLVTLDEIPDLSDLRLRTLVNGRVVQDGSTSQMVFTVPQLVAYVSQAMTLEPGDIIATGTPAGVGFKRTPPILLHHGDLVEVEIDSIGRLSNRVVNAVRAGSEPSRESAVGAGSR